jgi:hypothetical protein
MRRIACLTLLLVLSLPCPPGRGRGIAVNPPDISIGALYNGSWLTVTGSAPRTRTWWCASPARRRAAHEGEGRALGLLWMNMDSLTFTGVPRSGLVHPTGPWPSWQGRRELGLAGVAARVGVRSSHGDSATCSPTW